MSRKKLPSFNRGMKLLFIPCLIAALSLSAFKDKESLKESSQSLRLEKQTVAFTDPYVWTTVEVVFTDLDGIEYQDVWVDFFDENHYPVTVYDVTLNYKLSILPTNYTENKSQLLSGNSFFLLEDNAIYFIPGTGGGGWSYYDYTLLPGTGYTVY